MEGPMSVLLGGWGWLGVWLLCAITAAVIAGGKGRAWGWWLLLGLVIGIFAVVMVAFLPALDPELARAKRAEAEARHEKPLTKDEYVGWTLGLIGLIVLILLIGFSLRS